EVPPGHVGTIPRIEAGAFSCRVHGHLRVDRSRRRTKDNLAFGSADMCEDRTEAEVPDGARTVDRLVRTLRGTKRALQPYDPAMRDRLPLAILVSGVPGAG